MGPFDSQESRPNQKEIESAIRELIDMHRSGKIELVISRMVKEELNNLLNDPTRASKAKNALMIIQELSLRKLPRTPADIGKATIGEARIGQECKFTDLPKKPSDRDIAEYLTANHVKFFVVIDDRHFIDAKTQIEQRLQPEGTRMVTPQELVKHLRANKLTHNPPNAV